MNLKNNIILVFQPHRYTRTKLLMKEFVNILSQAKYLILLETYAAGEKIIRGATSKNIYQNILRRNRNILFLKDINNLEKSLKEHTLNKNTIIFMGAGSISNLAKQYINS